MWRWNNNRWFHKERFKKKNPLSSVLQGGIDYRYLPHSSSSS
jgi:hypothetical protein